jgi:protein phosphatase
VRFSAAGATDRGPRQSNQDTHLIDVELGLFVVADGMGGHNAGEVASRMAADAVADFIRATHNKGGDITWPFPLDLSRSIGVNRMHVALRLANARVHDAGERDVEHAGMGTTIVAVLVEGDRLIIGHVGDSRAYLWRAGALKQMTQDHTWLNAINEGREDIHNHPLRHVLTNGIGMGAELSPTVADEPVLAGDRWLMCTDGVHGYLDKGTLQQLMSGPSVDAIASEVVRRAVSSGTNDNATAVVLNVE